MTAESRLQLAEALLQTSETSSPSWASLTDALLQGSYATGNFGSLGMEWMALSNNLCVSFWLLKGKGELCNSNACVYLMNKMISKIGVWTDRGLSFPETVWLKGVAVGMVSGHNRPTSCQNLRKFRQFDKTRDRNSVFNTRFLLRSFWTSERAVRLITKSIRILCFNLIYLQSPFKTAIAVSFRRIQTKFCK